MNLRVKATNGDVYELTIESGTMSVAELKTVISDKASISVDAQRLIFKGHVLKDPATLDSYGIAEGNTIILVKGTKKSSTPSPTPSNASASSQPQSYQTPSTNPFSTPAQQPNPNATFGQGNGASGMPSMQEMQRQMMANPEMMSQMMESPMMQSLMDNPALMQSLMSQNPQIQALMEQNPEMAQMMRDPELLRQSLAAARNPELMREMTRGNDRMLSNIEAHPEGFNALRRMYEDVQAPMMDALGPNGRSAPTVIDSDTSTTPQDAPMPNPWAPAQPAAPTGNAPTTFEQEAPSINPFGNMFGSGVNPMVGAMDPAAAAQMLENPMMQQMMAQMMSNPDQLETMMQLNPQTRQLMESNPQMREMIRSENFRNMMGNPDTVRAMLQMQAAMSQFQGGNAMPSSTGSNESSQPATANPFASMFGSAAAQPAAPSQVGNPFSAMFGGGTSTANPYAGMFGVPAAAPSGDAARPEIVYREQISQLNNMGFVDAEANLNALIATGGNIQAAVDRLLQG